MLTAAATGRGFTVIVKVTGVPAQPLAAGVTVINPEIGALLVLVVRKAAIPAPVPLAARLIAVLSFVQE